MDKKSYKHRANNLKSIKKQLENQTARTVLAIVFELLEETEIEYNSDTTIL